MTMEPDQPDQPDRPRPPTPPAGPASPSGSRWFPPPTGPAARRLARRGSLGLLVLVLLIVAVQAAGPWLARRLEPFEDRLALASELARQLSTFHHQHPSLSMFVFTSAMTVVAAIDFPSPPLLILAGGAVLGRWLTVALALPAVALGSLFPFVMARYAFGPIIERRFPRLTRRLRDGVGRDGPFYLASLRLVPLMPFGAVNLFMGLTPITGRTFFLVTLVARLPMTLVQADAGTHLAKVRTLGDLLAPRLVLALLVMAVLPWLLRGLLRWLRDRFRGGVSG